MEKLKAPSWTVPHMSIAYDRKDSTNAFEGAKATSGSSCSSSWTAQFYAGRRGEGQMVAKWRARCTGQIKGGVKVECQHGSKVELLYIEDEVPSPTERNEIAAVVAEIKEDLRPRSTGKNPSRSRRPAPIAWNLMRSLFPPT